MPRVRRWLATLRVETTVEQPSPSQARRCSRERKQELLTHVKKERKETTVGVVEEGWALHLQT